jgi:hypothetical protein
MPPPREVLEVNKPKAASGDQNGSYGTLVERSFSYTNNGLTTAAVRAAVDGKLVVVLTGSSNMPGMTDFFTKQVPALQSLSASKDVVFVYLDVDKVKDDDSLQAKLAKKAGKDSPQILILNVKPGEDKKPVLDLDSLVSIAPGNKEKFAKLLELAKKDVVKPDAFALPQMADSSSKVLPKVDIARPADEKTAVDEAAERKAMEELAEIFKARQKAKEEQQAAEKKRRDEGRDKEVRRVNAQTGEMEKKYPYLKGFNDEARRAWLKDKFPLLDHQKFDETYSAAYDKPRSMWNSGATNERLSGEAVSRVYRDRDDQWKAFLKLGGEDSEDGHKAYLLARDIAKDGGYPRMSRDDLRRYDSLADKYTNDCVQVLADRAKPGSPNRDLAAWVISDALRFYAPKRWEPATKLYSSLKELTKPDSKDEPPPLTRDQFRYTVENIFLLNGSQGKFANGGIMFGCIDDLKALNDPDSLYTIDSIARLRDTDPYLKPRLSDLSAQLKANVSDRWADQAPQPFKKEAERVSDLTPVLDKQLPRVTDPDGAAASDEIVSAIARNYKFYRLTTAHKDSIAQLSRVLDCPDSASRLAAATVFLNSDLPADNPDRLKAVKSLVDLAVNKNSGARFRQEANTLLDDLMKAQPKLVVGDYKLTKEQDLGLVIEDKQRNWYTVSDDGKLQYHDHESLFEGSAKLILTENGIRAEYRKGSRVTSRSATFDGDDLSQMTWTEEGYAGPFIATRKKEDGKYVDKYVLRIPAEKENGLSREIDIEGKFEFRRNGTFKYIGEDFRKGTNRKLAQIQEIGDLGVREYRN